MDDKMSGNPSIVATNDRYHVIKRGSRYGILRDGEPLSSVKSWSGKGLLVSRVMKGGYTEVNPPKPYKEG